jgi:hypothetical protein
MDHAIYVSIVPTMRVNPALLESLSGRVNGGATNLFPHITLGFLPEISMVTNRRQRHFSSAWSMLASRCFFLNSSSIKKQQNLTGRFSLVEF